MSSEAIERMPRPPIWMATRMITWPAGDQCTAVLTVVRPVTEKAETAVNMASCRGVA